MAVWFILAAALLLGAFLISRRSTIVRTPAHDGSPNIVSQSYPELREIENKPLAFDALSS